MSDLSTARQGRVGGAAAARAVRKPGLPVAVCVTPQGGPGHSTEPVCFKTLPPPAGENSTPFSQGQEGTKAATPSKEAAVAGQGQNVSSGSRAQASEPDQPGSGPWLGPSLNTPHPHL